MMKMISKTLLLTLAVAGASLGARSSDSVTTRLYCKHSMNRQDLIDFLGKHHGLSPTQAANAVFLEEKGLDRHMYCFEVDYPTGSGVNALRDQNKSKDVASSYQQRVRLLDGTTVRSKGLSEQQLSQDAFLVDSDIHSKPGQYK